MKRFHPSRPASVYRTEWPFRIFLFDKLILSEVGRPMWVSHHERAATLEIALWRGKQNEWRYVGILQDEIDAGPALSAFCDAYTAEQDRLWLEDQNEKS